MDGVNPSDADSPKIASGADATTGDAMKDKLNPVGCWVNPKVPLHIPPDAPLNATLRWVISQLSDGFFEVHEDQRGEATSLMLGQEAASRQTFPMSEVVEHVRKRGAAISLCGLFARARERGTEPGGLQDLSEEFRLLSSSLDVDVNTEIHYALELMDVLDGIRQRATDLPTLPIVGLASSELSVLLGEATKAHLYGLHTACVALCRSLLEKALTECVPGPAFEEENRRNPRSGPLANLIRAAGRVGLLTPQAVTAADDLRRSANNVLHGDSHAKDSYEAIADVRWVIGELFRVDQ
jgi:hypothetical protein